MQEDANDLNNLRNNRTGEDKRLLMSRWLLNSVVAVLSDASQYVRHIAYNAIINLISVRWGFRDNEMPFFRIPTNGTRRSACFTGEQGVSLKPQLATYSSRFVLLTRMYARCSVHILASLPSNFELTTTYRSL